MYLEQINKISVTDGKRSIQGEAFSSNGCVVHEFQQSLSAAKVGKWKLGPKTITNATL